jgi:hypothetical protein
VQGVRRRMSERQRRTSELRFVESSHRRVPVQFQAQVARKVGGTSVTGSVEAFPGTWNLPCLTVRPGSSTAFNIAHRLVIG